MGPQIYNQITILSSLARTLFSLQIHNLLEKTKHFSELLFLKLALKIKSIPSSDWPRCTGNKI